MTDQELHYITTAAQCRSISKAAEQLFLSQPSLSQTIQKIEAEYGVSLFIRSQDGIKPTVSGIQYLKAAKEIRQLYQQMENRLQAHSNLPNVNQTMNSRELEQMVTFADTGSFSKAAQNLQLNRSSLHRCLKRLEEAFGTPLFYRLKEGWFNGQTFFPSGYLFPTEAGTIYLAAARKILSRIRLLKQEMMPESGQCRLQFGLFHAFFREMYAILYPAFCRHFPEVTLAVRKMTALVAEQALLDGKLDLAFIPEPENQLRFHFEPIYRRPLLLLARKGDPLAAAKSYDRDGKRCISLLDLQGQTFFLQSSKTRLTTACLKAFRRINFAPKLYTDFTYLEEKIVAMLQEGGYTLLDEGTVPDWDLFDCYALAPDSEIFLTYGVASLIQPVFPKQIERTTRLIRELAPEILQKLTKSSGTSE